MSYTDFNNQTWLIDGEGANYCAANPDNKLCLLRVPTNYTYHINLAANITFLAIFSTSLAAISLIWIITRRSTVFTLALALGLLCEILGYVGRILSWVNPWAQEGFIMQLCCLTIGPAFMAASLYLCLRRIVAIMGPQYSRIPPRYYTRIVR